MRFYLNSHTYGAIHFKRIVPASLAQWRLPGSQPYSVEGIFGKILLQQVTAGRAEFIHMICRIKQNLALDFQIPGRPWLIPISLKNESRFDIGSELVCLKQGQYNMVRAAGSGTLYLEKGNDYETICVSFDRRQLRWLCPFFRDLHSFIRHSHSKTPAFVFGNHKRIDSQLSNIVDQLLHCRYRGDRRRRYFDHKVKELVSLLINRHDTKNKMPKAVNDSPDELMKQTKHLLKSRFNQSATLFKIARQLGMNKIKLQNSSR